MTGFADEAGGSLEAQIRAHQSLGWDTIEMRNVNGKNFTELNDDDYKKCRDQLAAAKMGVSCFGSAIANWARKITNPLQQDVDDLRRAAPRMRELGTKFIRIMSYPNDNLPEKDWFNEVVRRLKELTKIAENEGVVLAHENCSGYGGTSPNAMRELLAEISSPAFGVAFDTGNPPSHDVGHCVEGRTWEYYQIAKPFIVHVHVKDAKPGADGKPAFCFPGEGVGDVRRVLADLAKDGYNGFVSIEPHIKAVIHLNQKIQTESDAFNTYIEYGRRAEKIVKDVSGTQSCKCCCCQ
jgi:sugar phosphate isomerase/epimerase